MAERARGPNSATRSATDPGPRELLITTSKPCATASRASCEPMCPEPMKPIVVMPTQPCDSPPHSVMPATPSLDQCPCLMSRRPHVAHLDRSPRGRPGRPFRQRVSSLTLPPRRTCTGLRSGSTPRCRDRSRSTSVTCLASSWSMRVGRGSASCTSSVGCRGPWRLTRDCVVAGLGLQWPCRAAPGLGVGRRRSRW